MMIIGPNILIMISKSDVEDGNVASNCWLCFISPHFLASCALVAYSSPYPFQRLGVAVFALEKYEEAIHQLRTGAIAKAVFDLSL